MVSVILVNHNYAKYLPDAIESVMQQTYQDFELIIIDGASTDDSRKVIYDFALKYSKKITAVLKPTSGQAAAFNLGFKISKGDTIAFLDADDYFANNKLEVISREHEKYNFVGTARYLVKENSMLPLRSCIDDYDVRPALLKNYEYIYTYALTTSCISINKGLANEIFPMPEEDYTTFADCYVKVFAQYLDNIRYIDNPLTYYRIHKDQQTHILEERGDGAAYGESVYKRTFKSINHKIVKKGMSPIPQLSNNNFKIAFCIANGFDKVAENYVMYGTGDNSYDYSKLIEAIGGSFLYAIDGDTNKWGKTWKGLPIYSPEEGIKRLNTGDVIIIGSNCYRKEIKEILISYGLKENSDFYMIKSIPND